MKIKLGLIFGGRSTEHEISLISTENILQNLNKKKYSIVLIGIDKNGLWYYEKKSKYVKNDIVNFEFKKDKKAVIIPHENKGYLLDINKKNKIKLDIVFPVLHGNFGEDGCVQGLLKTANIPFVGAGVLGSAISMDKDITKRLLIHANIKTAKYFSYYINDKIKYNEIVKTLKLPVFIKPANQGSSVGVYKAYSKKEIKENILKAFMFDKKIIIEEFVDGREIECSVIGNSNVQVSIPGEIITNTDFYSYESKYIDEKGAILDFPAKLSKKTKKEIQNLSLKVYKILCLEGMARVDLFIKENGEIYINEVNTIPGFTNISMYPKLWEVSGEKVSVVLDRLISLGLERFNNEKKLITDFKKKDKK